MKLSPKSAARFLFIAIGSVIAAAPAVALNFADPATAPVVTTAPPSPTTNAAQQAGALKVTVDAVSGSVQVRNAEDQPWQPAKVGMVVDEGAEFRTGPRSSVRCSIPPDQSFTLDRLGTVKVLQAIRNGDKLKTDMLMKYGRTKYSVEGAGLEHESTIASPSGTLAVRGTVVSLYDQPPYAPQAASYTGQALFRDAHRKTSLGSKNGGLQVVTGNNNSAADTALTNSVTDPKFAAARTAADNALIASEVSRGGVVSFDALANILVIRGGSPIKDDRQLASSLPGKLNFVARWFGNSDVNLEVFADIRDPLTALFDPKGFQPGEFLYPGYGLNNSKSGGHIAFDHRGGPNGGTEIAFWTNPPAAAVYGLGALLISGPPVELKINAFLDGKKQSIFYIDSTGNFVKTKTLDVTLNSDSLIGGPIIFIPAVPILEDTTTNVGDGGTNTASKATRHHHKTVASGAKIPPAPLPSSGNTTAASAKATSSSKAQPFSTPPAPPAPRGGR